MMVPKVPVPMLFVRGPDVLAWDVAREAERTRRASSPMLKKFRSKPKMLASMTYRPAANVAMTFGLLVMSMAFALRMNVESPSASISTQKTGPSF